MTGSAPLSGGGPVILAEGRDQGPIQSDPTQISACESIQYRHRLVTDTIVAISA